MKKDNPLKLLEALGQSIWLDYIRRDLIVSGALRRMIEADGLRGMTSNPAIFEKAIAGSHDYDEDIRALALAGKDPEAIYEALSQCDVLGAACEFRPLYDRTAGLDGYVSLEVNPHLAHDTQGTLAEARRLWSALDRPNVLIKVPATPAGLPAIRQLIAEGINVNVTLIFDLTRYRQVAEAYLAGLEARVAQGLPLKSIASVASFFLSRIDTLADPRVEPFLDSGGPKGELARKTHGQVATASAKLAYRIFRELFGNERYNQLAGKGARVQRLLWASTGAKNPDFSEIKYIEPLIGPNTVSTLPPDTLAAYREYGDPASRIEQDVEEANEIMTRLPELGIDIELLSRQLEEEGIGKFEAPFDKLLATLTQKSQNP